VLRLGACDGLNLNVNPRKTHAIFELFGFTTNFLPGMLASNRRELANPLAPIAAPFANKAAADPN
jgi:hypothetical protein